MNGPVRQGMIPQSGIPQPPSNSMLSIGNTPFMQNPAHLAQAQGIGGPQPMNPNPPMGMLSGGPPQAGRYPLPQSQQRPGQMFRQGPSGPQLSSGPTTAAQMQAQLQGMQFPMPGPNNPRRVSSQQPINSMGGMPASMEMGMPMNMNPQGNIQGQLRPGQHPSQQVVNQRMMMHQHNQMVQMRAQVPNPQGLPPPMARTPSSQVMDSLSPVGSIPHPSGLQPPHHQNPFPNGAHIPPQHLQPQQLASSPRPTQNHTPGMPMGIPGPSNNPMNVNRHRTTPDNSNMPFAYSGSQFPSGTPRVTPNPTQSGYPPFVPSTSPMQMDITQSSPPNMIHPPVGTANRQPFMSSPSQAYEGMNGNTSMDSYPSNFGMPPPPNIPPRPPSHTGNPHQPPTPQQHHQALQQSQQQSRHQSPSQSDQNQMNMPRPQRPQSQPQQIPGRPPSQTATRTTPRAPHMQLPASNLSNLPLTATGRLPPSQQTQGPPGSTMMPIAPRPPQPQQLGPGSVPPPPPVHPSTQGAIDAPSVVAPIQRPPLPGNPGGPSLGQGLLRVLQFSGVLASETKTKAQFSWWSDLIKEYFTPKAVMKLTLWRDSQRTEAKPFVTQEIGVPILPRFFLVTTQSGVKSMSLSLDGGRERHFQPGLPGHTIVECVSAVWTWKYLNGYTVSLKGPLTVRVMLVITGPANGTQPPQYTLKFDDFQFDAGQHEKYISVDAIIGTKISDPKPSANLNAPWFSGLKQQQQQQQQQQGAMFADQRFADMIEEEKRWDEPNLNIERATMPGEPVNDFGIPQATMRCLELAESVSAMTDLISFAGANGLGPRDALARYATKLRDSQAASGESPQPTTIQTNGSTSMTLVSHPFPSFPPSIGQTPPVTLYTSAPPSVTNPQPTNSSSSMNNSPKNTPSQTNSPDKQNKTIPPPQQSQTPSQSGGPASSPAVSSGGTTNNTPALANTGLKRKQAGDASSPTVGNSEQPSKRAPRKRVRAGTNSGAG